MRKALWRGLTVPHYFDFGVDRDLVGGDLIRPDRWDALRTQSRSVFAMATSRAEFERQVEERPELRARAAAIDAVLNEMGAVSVASYGVGGGALELSLHHISPQRKLILTDYGPETVASLARLFPEANVVEHDLRKEGPLEADVHLFHRVDTEFRNSQWKRIFRRYADKAVLFIPGEIADFARIRAELERRLFVRGLSRAGWLRNERALEALWRRTHEAQPIHVHDLDGWVLRPA